MRRSINTDSRGLTATNSFILQSIDDPKYMDEESYEAKDEEESKYNNDTKYKYDEDQYIDQIQEYIENTYNQHYSSNKYQATEFIIDGGHGTGFCIGNIMKYAQRYGRKGDRDAWRKDLLKVIHYSLIQLHVHDNESKDELN